MSSEQHNDMSDARRDRDTSDLDKVHTWFSNNNPFSKEDENLKSLSTGLVGGEELTFGIAETVGEAIHRKLDNVPMTEAKIKRTDI